MYRATDNNASISRGGGDRNLFAGLIRITLNGLLRVVELEEHGRVVEVDSFTIRDTRRDAPRPEADIASTWNSDYQKLQSIRWSEARIELVARILYHLLSYVDLRGGGRALDIDGFRLKNLADWRVHGKHVGNLFLYLRWNCGARCTFCYQDSTHPSFQDLKPHISSDEIYTRLKYYDPQSETALFDQRFFETNEVMNHPQFLDVLRKFREKEKSRYLFFTHGNYLDEAMIERLAHLGPLAIRLSLNSANPRIRREIMRDSNAETAIRSLPLLKQYRIPSAISLLALPVLPADDIENTIRYADEHDAQYVVIHFPGFSRYLAEPHRRSLSLGARKKEIVHQVRTIRESVKIPVTFLTDFYERHIMGESKIDVRVKGVVKNSPARRAGLRVNDVILDINGTRVMTGSKLAFVMNANIRMNRRKVSFGIMRGNHRLDIELDEDSFTERYPYIPRFCPLESRYGVEGILTDKTGIDPDVLDRIRSIGERHEARCVLLLMSVLMRSAFEELVEKENARFDFGLETAIPENVFWGGNVFTADHLMVSDLIGFIEDWIDRNGRRPDVVMVPSSIFAWAFGWRRDVAGRPYLDIERKTTIPVELL